MRLITLTVGLLLLAPVEARSCEYFVPETSVRACELATDPLGGLLRESRESILAALGLPEATETKDVPNPYTESQTDFAERFIYARTQLTVLFLNGDDGRPLPILLQTDDPKLVLRFGIHVGMPTSDLIEIIGESSQKTPRGWIYGGEANELYVDVEDGKIRSILWFFYRG